MPKLMFVRGLREGESFTFAPPGCFLGRETDNDLQLLADGVSRYHAKLTEDGAGTWQVIDLESSNGVKVNGKRADHQALADGDLVALGKVVLRFIADPPPPPAPAAPPSGPGQSPVSAAPPVDALTRQIFHERDREIQRLIREALENKRRRLRRIMFLLAVLANLLLLAGFILYYQNVIRPR